MIVQLGQRFGILWRTAGKAILTMSAILVTCIILYYLLTGVDLQSIAQTILAINAVYLASFLLLEALVIVVMAKRFQVILQHMGTDISFIRCFFVNMATYPLISLAPSVSGNLAKVLYLKGESSSAKTVSAIITERLFDFSILIALAAIGLYFYLDTGTFAILLLLASALLLLVIGILSMREHGRGRIVGKAKEILWVVLCMIRNKPAALIVSMYTLVAWALALLQVYLFFLAVGASVPLLGIVLKMPVAMIIGQLPVTLSGMGTRDGAMISLFSDISGEQVLAAGLLFTVVRYWVPAVAGILFMFIENHRALATR